MNVLFKMWLACHCQPAVPLAGPEAMPRLIFLQQERGALGQIPGLSPHRTTWSGLSTKTRIAYQCLEIWMIDPII